MSIKYFLDQNYEEIKARCLKSNQLFVDDKFPPDKTSISTKSNDGEQFQWRRSKDIISNPQFIVGSIQPTDLDQGQIGNCWLISALSALASNQELVNLVVPQDQNFEQNYAGIFRFRFWCYGEWFEVVVDDHLPTRNYRLTFCRNMKDQNEMFGPLLEKAYAKLNKCYFNLISGEIMDALIDLTGGVHESFKIKKFIKQPQMDENKLWNTILSSFEMKSMIGCAIDTKNGVQEGKGPNNLVTGHAYTILGAYEIIHENFKNFQFRKSSSEDVKNKDSIKLLKIRNPWGLESSYTGKWSLNSKEWSQISDSIKNKLGVNEQTDGQFFIAYEEFIKFFDAIDMVHVNLNAFYGPSNQTYSPIKWISNQFYGAWVPGVNSGGCLNYGQESYWKNPQYVIELQLRNNIDQYVSIIVSLMQTETLKLREQTGSYNGSREAIGFYIYKIKDEKAVTDKTKPIDPKNLNLVDSSVIYLYQREISKRCDLLPGSYVIVPSCYKKDVAMKFLLRVFIEGELENAQKSLQLFDLNKNSNEIIQKNTNTNKENEERDSKNLKEMKPNRTPRDSKELNENENNQNKDRNKNIKDQHKEEKEKNLNSSMTNSNEKKKEDEKMQSKENKREIKDDSNKNKEHKEEKNENLSVTDSIEKKKKEDENKQSREVEKKDKKDPKSDNLTNTVFLDKKEIKDNSNNKEQKETHNLNKKDSESNINTNNNTNNVLPMYQEPSDEAFNKYINSLRESQKNNQIKIEITNDESLDQDKDAAIGGRVTSTACLLM